MADKKVADKVSEKKSDAPVDGKLIDGKQEVPLTRVRGKRGSDGLSVGKVLSTTGDVVYDPGFTNTAACSSAVTYIDGGAGVLQYRGYPIEQLAKNSSFLETAYLLIYKELPKAATLEAFLRRIKRHRMLHEDFKAFFTAFPHNGHPMAILQAGVAGLATYYQETLDPADDEALDLASVLLLAKMPTMISYIHKRAVGLPLLYPDARRSYTEDFIRMTFGLPYQSYDIDPTIVRALDMLFILHADHEQNCSTSTVRVVGSSHANLYASVAAGIGALSGPLHGGANEAVLRMLQRIRDSKQDVKDFVNRVKDKDTNERLMGFGHRVYKNYDPRAAIVKDVAHDVLDRLGRSDELLEIAMQLEEIALNDDYFIERKLYPNVDFYTGLIYSAMGFPMKMFTPLFALGRLPGWIAQYHEMARDPETRIGRPRQVYTGELDREYVPLRQRTIRPGQE
ncbi:citrate synthase [Gleimia hominis]|uniref:Citrate synthase n=1 Tax=Gleimia hominis TaxID=595468 RepID=A0ABU3IF05_9ACTO|nr:citrate synthase [Gleimia hominis]MDT3767825.1 citrate synthase [Gleimia hominis]